MNLFKEQGVKDYAGAASQIPVIDFGPYFAAETGALERLAAELGDACENIGFFYALGHGVDEAIIDRAFAASRRFHALPLDQKLQLKLNDNMSATCRSMHRCRALRPYTKRHGRTRTRAFSSATIAVSTTLTSRPAFRCVAVTNGQRPYPTSAPI